MISVVICTYNRADLLAAALQTLCDQSQVGTSYEVIIVDNNSSDTTPLVSQDFAARYPHIRYCLETQQGLSHARNRGWQAAKGEYVAYLDDDCKAPPHWLHTADVIIRTVAPQVFGGPYFAMYNSPKPHWFNDEYGSYAPYPKATFINDKPDLLHGGNLFIARQLLVQVGGFDGALGMAGDRQAYGEETALLRQIRAARPATTFYYDPALWVYHLVRPEKMRLGWQMQAQFMKGRSIAHVYVNPQAQGRGRAAHLLRMAGLALLIGASLVRGIFWRNRAKLPHFYNFVYETSLPQITRLGQLYEYAHQPAVQGSPLAPTANAPTASPPETAATVPLISVLVAAWNEEAYLAAFLDSYCAITYPHKELILCAGGGDNSYQLAQGWQKCGVTLLLQHEGEGKYSALQRGLAQARGTIIYLTDADSVLDDASFARVIAPIVDGTETVVTGGFRPLTAQVGLPFVVAQWMMEQGERSKATTQSGGHPIYTPFLVGANCALARATLAASWRDPLENSIGEDYYLALQLQAMGQQIRFCPASSIQTRYPTTISKYILRKSRWHRSYLLHHYHLGDRRWLRNCLSACRFQLLLALPLLPLLIGLPGVVLWAMIWTWYFAHYQSRKAWFTASNQEGVATVRLYHLFLLMIADFCAWAMMPWQLIVPKWRKQW